MYGVKTEEEVPAVPIHVTPNQLAKMTGMDRAEVIDTCRKHSIPVLHGRIDKSLFMLSVESATRSDSAESGR